MQITYILQETQIFFQKKFCFLNLVLQQMNNYIQLAKTEILLKSKILSLQLVEHLTSNGFVRSAYLCFQFTCPHLRKKNLEFV